MRRKLLAHHLLSSIAQAACVLVGEEKWSWRVVAGQNAAYDQFSNQYQLYYRGKGKGTLWYDPVFQVRLLCIAALILASIDCPGSGAGPQPMMPGPFTCNAGQCMQMTCQALSACHQLALPCSWVRSLTWCAPPSVQMSAFIVRLDPFSCQMLPSPVAVLGRCEGA